MRLNPKFCWIILATFFFSECLFGHSMEMGVLKVAILDDRAVVELTLHKDVLNIIDQSLQGGQAHSSTAPTSVFSGATITLSEEGCEWLLPSLKKIPLEGNAVKLEMVAICPPPRFESDQFSFKMPSLVYAPKSLTVYSDISFVGQLKNIKFNLSSESVGFSNVDGERRNFFGFILMGVRHMGLHFKEWVDPKVGLKLPEGLDHLLFCFCLVLTSVALPNLFWLVSGFTIGHFITLSLSVFEIIHVHSKWIEVGIALSIAYFGWLGFKRKEVRHGVLVTALVGLIHGLGFASALQDTQLAKDERLPALIGFNLGIEVAQCFVIAAVYALFALVKSFGSEKILDELKKISAMAITLVSAFWVVTRALG